MSVRSTLIQAGKDRPDWQTLFSFYLGEYLYVAGCTTGGTSNNANANGGRNAVEFGKATGNPQLEIYAYDTARSTWSCQTNALCGVPSSASGYNNATGLSSPSFCVPQPSAILSSARKLFEELHQKCEWNIGSMLLPPLCGACRVLVHPSLAIVYLICPQQWSPVGSASSTQANTEVEFTRLVPFTIYALSMETERWSFIHLQQQQSAEKNHTSSSFFEKLTTSHFSTLGFAISNDGSKIFLYNGAGNSFFALKTLDKNPVGPIFDLEFLSSASPVKTGHHSSAAQPPVVCRYFPSLTCHHNNFLLVTGGFIRSRSPSSSDMKLRQAPTFIYEISSNGAASPVVHVGQTLASEFCAPPYILSTAVFPQDQRYAFVYGLPPAGQKGPRPIFSGFYLFDLVGCKWLKCMLFGVALPTPRFGTMLAPMVPCKGSGNTGFQLMCFGGVGWGCGQHSAEMKEFHDLFLLEVDAEFEHSQKIVSTLEVVVPTPVSVADEKKKEEGVEEDVKQNEEEGLSLGLQVGGGAQNSREPSSNSTTGSVQMSNAPPVVQLPPAPEGRKHRPPPPTTRPRTPTRPTTPLSRQPSVECSAVEVVPFPTEEHHPLNSPRSSQVQQPQIAEQQNEFAQMEEAREQFERDEVYFQRGQEEGKDDAYIFSPPKCPPTQAPIGFPSQLPSSLPSASPSRHVLTTIFDQQQEEQTAVFPLQYGTQQVEEESATADREHNMMNYCNKNTDEQDDESGETKKRMVNSTFKIGGGAPPGMPIEEEEGTNSRSASILTATSSLSNGTASPQLAQCIPPLKRLFQHILLASEGGQSSQREQEEAEGISFRALVCCVVDLGLFDNTSSSGGMVTSNETSCSPSHHPSQPNLTFVDNLLDVLFAYHSRRSGRHHHQHQLLFSPSTMKIDQRCFCTVLVSFAAQQHLDLTAESILSLPSAAPASWMQGHPITAVMMSSGMFQALSSIEVATLVSKRRSVLETWWYRAIVQNHTETDVDLLFVLEKLLLSAGEATIQPARGQSYFQSFLTASDLTEIFSRVCYRGLFSQHRNSDDETGEENPVVAVSNFSCWVMMELLAEIVFTQQTSAVSQQTVTFCKAVEMLLDCMEMSLDDGPAWDDQGHQGVHHEGISHTLVENNTFYPQSVSTNEIVPTAKRVAIMSPAMPPPSVVTNGSNNETISETEKYQEGGPKAEEAAVLVHQQFSSQVFHGKGDHGDSSLTASHLPLHNDPMDGIHYLSPEAKRRRLESSLPENQQPSIAHHANIRGCHLSASEIHERRNITPEDAPAIFHILQTTTTTHNNTIASSSAPLLQKISSLVQKMDLTNMSSSSSVSNAAMSRSQPPPRRQNLDSISTNSPLKQNSVHDNKLEKVGVPSSSSLRVAFSQKTFCQVAKHVFPLNLVSFKTMQSFAQQFPGNMKGEQHHSTITHFFLAIIACSIFVWNQRMGGKSQHREDASLQEVSLIVKEDLKKILSVPCGG